MVITLLKNFLYRILMILFCIIGFPIYLGTVVIYWTIVVCTFCTILPIMWILFGSVGTTLFFKCIDLYTYKKLFHPNEYYEYHNSCSNPGLTPTWWLDIFEKMTDTYKSMKIECERFN